MTARANQSQFYFKNNLLFDEFVFDDNGLLKVQYIVQNIINNGRCFMQRISLGEDIKPLSEFRANASACLKQVHDNKRPIVITQHGKSSAVLMNVGEYEVLMDKIELLQDIQAAEQEIKENKVVSNQKAKNELLAKIKK